MRIFITGVAGTLGSRVAARLASGYELVGMDMREVEGFPGRFVRADLCDYAQVLPEVQGCAVVVHCAAIHPWKPYPDESYLDLNVKGTYQVVRACAAAGVAHLVQTSSIAAVGYQGSYPVEEMPLPETRPAQVRDLYSLTKQLGDEIARTFQRAGGPDVVLLQPTNFVPREDPIDEGLALLGGAFTHPDDVADAHALAVTARVSGVVPLTIGPELPFTAADVRLSQTDPAAAVERHFPGAAAFLQERGHALSPLPPLLSIERAYAVLGWRPQRTFARWWEEHGGDGAAANRG
jgi:UDP-glucose 4-epimerase